VTHASRFSIQETVSRMAKQPRSLSDKVVVITGGGRGIGAATAQALVGEGARVAIGDVDLETAQATAARLGERAIALHLDVTDRPGFTAFLDAVEERLGPIDVMINNAGIMPVVRADEETDAGITRQLEINLHGVIHGTAEAMRRMKPRRTGHIVNIASVAGKGGVPGLATYCATKHGVVGYTEAVRFELRGLGVQTTVVMPSLVATELTSGIQDGRAVKRVTADEVATAIVDALKFPQFDVYVPKSVGRIARVMGPLPRSFREALARWLKADTVIIDAAGSPERAAYEARAAASAPAADEQIKEAA
jgi:NAD(P)-dependent dehydrogenase (short-subunit alcohol dehydrogenase family)